MAFCLVRRCEIGLLVVLAGLSAFGQNRTVRLSCPVTGPQQGSRFIPPYPYPAKVPSGTFWFGTDRLWTQLPVTGEWRGLGHYTPDDPTFRQKLAFWRQGYDAHQEPNPLLKVTGKRLDAPAPPLTADRANGSWTSNDSFIMTGINIPTLGCWEITARYQNDELIFVIAVTE